MASVSVKQLRARPGRWSTLVLVVSGLLGQSA